MALVLLAGLVFVFLSEKKNNSVLEFSERNLTPAESAKQDGEKYDFQDSQTDNSGTKTDKISSSSVLLNTPFLTQAPFGVWDPLHEDACEEASLIMVKHFLAKDKELTPTSGDMEILKLIQYEEKNGYGISVSLEKLNQIAREYLGMRTGRVNDKATVEAIKTELAAGRPVIIPAAGKILPNPNFRNGGPNYHMLVVKGYDKKGFITNDPGTKRGEGFHYTFDALYYAMHDWDAANILNGRKAYLVFD